MKKLNFNLNQVIEFLNTLEDHINNKYLGLPEHFKDLFNSDIKIVKKWLNKHILDLVEQGKQGE